MRTHVKALLSGIILATTMSSAAFAADKVVIAHRGASGYLPEHNAAGQGHGLRTGCRFPRAGPGDD
ncbi:Glycerophosphoryl diester phosphodiesterase precursor [Serratia rubidaea]|uniref:Glycerophosphoryl diester phosphodiesterase n=1 Tax=Serratia rubidaea TaxID=61652 RepID=A0A3S5DF82_SERRU|nr:Glycerophosphoryl diester phosphodiesterase precursor [Serratia rubidaea]